MRLVYIGTSGNQAYIFASNRLREAVGASRLLAEWTTDRVAEFAKVHDGWVLQSSSGGALVGAPSAQAARSLVTDVTSGALQAAPGLTITGVSVEMRERVPSVVEIDAVFAEFARHTASTPGPAARHQRTPLVAACSSTTAPAASWHTDGRLPTAEREAEAPAPRSAESISKSAARPDAARRMRSMLDDRALRDVDRFFESVDWVGVVHADGNGLGAFFRSASETLGGRMLGERTAFGVLSEQVRQVAEGALVDAVRTIDPGDGSDLSVLPLIVGGDDLTVLLDGNVALPFTAAYLQAFASLAAGRPLVAEVLAALDRPAFTASAGVAVVKPHFPFSVAHGLAEDLCREAKRRVAAHPGSHGLDVHVLLDSQVTDLAAIRRRYTLAEQSPVVLTDRPFLISGSATGEGVPPEYDWAGLVARASMLQAIPVGGGAALTRSQVHALRSELRADPVAAGRRLARLRRRAVDDEDRTRLATLQGADGLARGLLDVLELAPFTRGIAS